MDQLVKISNLEIAGEEVNLCGLNFTYNTLYYYTLYIKKNSYIIKALKGPFSLFFDRRECKLPFGMKILFK